MQDKLGGSGVSIQVDETVIGHNNPSVCPSYLEDNYPGIVWLLGMIESGTGRIKLFIVPNRTAETFTSIFLEHVNAQTTIYTDGHLSYPRAVAAVNSTHRVVNHSTGFKTAEGFHTNNIENLWSLLKYEVRRRRGVTMASAKNFIYEFSFRYMHLRHRTPSSMCFAFRALVEYLFNKST